MIWVVAQFVLLAATAVAWFLPPALHVAWLGVPLAALGVVLGVSAFVALGGAVTPLPRPRGPLVTHGPYRFVRHPMYVALVLVVAGISLCTSWTAFAVTAVLAVELFGKTRVEERHLESRFPEYAEYRRRTWF